MADLTPHPTLLQRVAEIRREVAGLLGDLDSGIKPKPARINPADSPLPGPVWEPADGWTIHAIEDEAEPAVYLDHARDWLSGELEALTPQTARRIAAALCAAADWADQLNKREGDLSA